MLASVCLCVVPRQGAGWPPHLHGSVLRACTASGSATLIFRLPSAKYRQGGDGRRVLAHVMSKHLEVTDATRHRILSNREYQYDSGVIPGANTMQAPRGSCIVNLQKTPSAFTSPQSTLYKKVAEGLTRTQRRFCVNYLPAGLGALQDKFIYLRKRAQDSMHGIVSLQPPLPIPSQYRALTSPLISLSVRQLSPGSTL